MRSNINWDYYYRPIKSNLGSFLRARNSISHVLGVCSRSCRRGSTTLDWLAYSSNHGWQCTPTSAEMCYLPRLQLGLVPGNVLVLTYIKLLMYWYACFQPTLAISATQSIVSCYRIYNIWHVWSLKELFSQWKQHCCSWKEMDGKLNCVNLAKPKLSAHGKTRW